MAMSLCGLAGSNRGAGMSPRRCRISAASMRVQLGAPRSNPCCSADTRSRAVPCEASTGSKPKGLNDGGRSRTAIAPARTRSKASVVFMENLDDLPSATQRR